MTAKPRPTSSQQPPMPPRETRVPQPWQPRYGMTFMLLVMLTMSIMAASGFYLVQALYGGRVEKMTFIMFTLISPVISVVVVSVGYSFVRFFIRPSS